LLCFYGLVFYSIKFNYRFIKKRKKVVENMGSISVFNCVYLIFLLASISEVGFSKMVFNVMNECAVADGITDNSKVIFPQYN